tara:strand:+ start:366 stop:1037 length:672 start_codon:yes stop_codon:yes gene_type:complete
MSHKCQYCGAEFKSERTIMVHVCEPKRRWLNKDEKYSRLAFHAFSRFYELTQAVGNRTFEDFVKSKFYLGFTKFGMHIININAINPEEYVDFVIQNSVKLDKWTSDAVYNIYVQELNRKESADRAVERSILLMQKWGEEYDRPFNKFFKEVSKPLAIHYIKSGRISPWVIFNSDNGAELIDSFSDEELVVINDYLEPSFWTRKFNARVEDVQFVKMILKKAGI